MTTCLLVRHGQSQANVDGILAGHRESTLTDEGLRQAGQVAESLRAVPLRRLVTSPLSRCRATAAEIAAAQPGLDGVDVEEGLAEVHYGAWTGRSLRELGEEELWATIQSAPSRVSFPPDDVHAHESMRAMAERTWSAWSHWEERVGRERGEHAVWAIVSHGDVIKALLARALGLGLDSFQSIVVDPGSVSVIRRQAGRTAVAGLNVRDDLFERVSRASRDQEDPPAGIGVVGGGNG